MVNQNNTDNNSQHQEKSFYKKNAWWIWILVGLIILFSFFRSLDFKNPFFASNEAKKETEIINTIKDNSDRIVDAINENGDKIGDKVDSNTESNNAGFQKITDSISAMKKECISCKEKPPYIKKPIPKPKPCPPTVKPKPKPKKKPCLPVEKPSLETKCEYILWNPDHTKSKTFSSREARKKFADEHGLILHEEEQ